MREMSVEAFQGLLAQQTSEVLLSFIEVSHPDLGEVLRYVCNTKAVVRADGTYYPLAFNAPSPAQKESNTSMKTNISIDNTDLEIGERMRNLIGPPTVTMFTALASHPDVVEEGPYEFSLTGLVGGESSISGQLGYDASIWDQDFPAQVYLPSNSPGLFM